MSEIPQSAENKVSFSQEGFDALSKKIQVALLYEAQIKDYQELFASAEGLEDHEKEHVAKQLENASSFVATVERLHAQIHTTGAALTEDEINSIETMLASATAELNKVVISFEKILSQYDQETEADEEVETINAPEVLPTADLGGLYAEANIEAIKKTDKFGDIVFKDHREVTSDLRQIFTDKGFTLDGREDGLLEYVRGSLSTIKNYEKILKRTDLSDESRDRFQNLLTVETSMFLREVAGFFQTEPRDEAAEVKSESLPEAGVQDVEAEIASSLAEFVLFEKLKTDSPIFSTAEFKNAAAAVKAVRENQTNNGGDPKVFADIRRVYQVTLAKKLRALQVKAEEMGGLAALTADEAVPVPAADPAPVVEPVVPVEPPVAVAPVIPEPVPAPVAATVPTPSEPVVEKTPINLEERIDLAVAAGAEFYQSLPAEFLNSSESIGKLNAAEAGLGEAKKEPNQVTKAVLVATFMNALAEAKAEYESWQKQKAAVSAVVIPDAKDSSLPEAINPYDMSLLEEQSKDSGTIVSAAAEISESKELDIDFNQLEALSVSAAKESSAVPASVAEDLYIKERTKSLEAKAAYGVKEAEFNKALQKHYSSDGFLARLSSDKKVLGINQDLPPALEAMRQDLRAARALYTESLNSALSERSKRTYVKLDEKTIKSTSTFEVGSIDNKKYDSEASATVEAFIRKFYLEPQQAQLAMQEKIILTKKQIELKNRVLEVMAKHKWLMRGGFVVAAGAAGAVTGGAGLALAGASWKAAKIAGSAYMGAAAAKNAYDYFAPKVEEAKADVAATVKGFNSSFSIKDMVAAGGDAGTADMIEGLAAQYGSKLLAQEKVVKKQRLATVGAAVAAGGLTGYGSGLLDNSVMAQAGAASTGGVYNAEAAPKVAGVIKAAEGVPVVAEGPGPVVIETMSVERATQVTELPPLVLKDISFGPEANAAAIPEAQRAAFNNEVRVLASDVLAGELSIPEARFETQLFEKMQAKFGQAAWWSEAKFSKVDVGKFPEREAAVTFTPTKIVADATPAAEVAAPKVEEVITKGDTVSEILLEKFGTKFEGMSDVERGQVLDRFFNRLDQNPDTIKELGLRSGDIDLIYPDEKLNLTVLERELDAELKPVAVEEPASAKTGVLKVEVEADTKSVPITVKEPAVPEAIKPEVKLASVAEVPAIKPRLDSIAAKVSTEALGAKVKYEPLTFPKITALNGQFLEHPQFIKLQNEIWSNGKGFERAVSDAVKLVERDTYDFTDTMFGSRYESPFTLLQDMRLDDYEKFQAQPNENLRFFLQQNNIKYETYLMWTDLIDDMKKEMPYQATTKIGDMFGRLVLDEAMAKHNINLKVKTT